MKTWVAVFTIPMYLIFVVTASNAQTSDAKFLNGLKEKSRSLSNQFGHHNPNSSKAKVYSELALSFISAVDSLKPIETRKIYRRKDGQRGVISEDAFSKLAVEEQVILKAVPCGNQMYYGYLSTPLAWARPFDRLGRHGFSSFDGKRILDFGFGNAGQLRMMASRGAQVTGIEIDNSVAHALYSREEDQGKVEKISSETQNVGSIRLFFGKWPAQEELTSEVGEGFDLFISKNVLKLGYIHPEKQAPDHLLIDLGVSDKDFLQNLMRILKPGGLAFIYNIHPPKTENDPIYKTWAYGETPWERELVKKLGFEIVQWHKDDTAGIHEFGITIGWNEPFSSYAKFKENYRAMYTILRKPLTK